MRLKGGCDQSLTDQTWNIIETEPKWGCWTVRLHALHISPNICWSVLLGSLTVGHCLAPGLQYIWKVTTDLLKFGLPVRPHELHISRLLYHLLILPTCSCLSKACFKSSQIIFEIWHTEHALLEIAVFETQRFKRCFLCWAEGVTCASLYLFSWICCNRKLYISLS